MAQGSGVWREVVPTRSVTRVARVAPRLTSLQSRGPLRGKGEEDQATLQRIDDFMGSGDSERNG